MNIFVTDSSWEGFYTAVFLAYNQKDSLLTSDENVQISLDSNIIRVESDKEKSNRVCAKLNKIDGSAEREIDLILRSCYPLKEQAAFEYIRLIVKRGAPVRGMLADPAVCEAMDIIRKVNNEAHNFKGFLRFMETDMGVFYAPYSPDNDITDLIVPHFVARFQTEKFVIHDVKRKYAAIYDGHDWITGEVGDAEIYLSQYEKSFENLWQKYYSAVNIESREHLKQMKGYMPVRYWKFMPEKRV